MFVQEFYLQQSCVVLRGFQVEFNLQFFGSRHLTLYAGIVEGVAVRQGNPSVVQSHCCPLGRINVPVDKSGEHVHIEFLAIRMTLCLCANRYRNMGYPHVFLVHGVGHPEVAVFRNAISLLNTSYILWTVALVVATVAHGRNLALYQVKRGIFQAVF